MQLSDYFGTDLLTRPVKGGCDALVLEEFDQHRSENFQVYIMRLAF